MSEVSEGKGRKDELIGNSKDREREGKRWKLRWEVKRQEKVFRLREGARNSQPTPIDVNC